MGRDVTTENFPDVFREYVLNERIDDLEAARSRYPYRTDVDLDRFNNEMIVLWFSITADPVSGKSPIDDFVERYVHGDLLTSMILMMKRGILDEFDLTEWNGEEIMARSRSDGTIYRIHPDQTTAERLRVARSFVGMLYRFDGGPYSLHGTAVTDSTHRILGMDDLLREYAGYGKMSGGPKMKPKRRVTTPPISPDAKILAELNRLPAAMINLVWKNLEIEEQCSTKREKARVISSVLRSERLQKVVGGLSESERDCLLFVVRNGWVAGHAGLQKKFGTDDTIKRLLKGGPLSTIGSLRCRGLLFVGMRKNVRAWYPIDDPPVFKKEKIAVIPLDIRNRLGECGFTYRKDSQTAAPAEYS